MKNKHYSFTSRLIRLTGLIFTNPRLFIRKIIIEYSAPTTLPAKLARKFLSYFVLNKLPNSGDKINRLLFVYDTISNPVTFDFLHYMAYADLVRRRWKIEKIDLLIVLRDNIDESREEKYIKSINEGNVNWRIFNLIIPLARLFSSVHNIHVVDFEAACNLSEQYIFVHPKGYCYVTPKNAKVNLDVPDFDWLEIISCPGTTKKIIDEYFPTTDPRKILTITLRSYNHIPVRNSDIKSWVAFALSLDPMLYRVIFIPDASVDGVRTFEEIASFERFDLASWNIGFRAALYSRSWLNMGVACGPLTISALLNNVGTIMIDRSQDYPSEYYDSCYRNTGVKPGVPLSFYSKSCYMYSGRDTKEHIIKVFNDFASEHA